MQTHRKACSPEMISELYSIPVGSLANMRSKRKGPKFYKLSGGRKVLYYLEDVEKWIKQNPVLTIDSIED